MTQGDQDLEEVLEKAEARIKGVTREASKIEDKLGVVDLEEWRKIARETEDSGMEKSTDSVLALKGVDDMIEGFEPGEMMIITGHTKHGKSRLAANIAWNVANQGKNCLFHKHRNDEAPDG
jgi:replicative DNA helicase